MIPQSHLTFIVPIAAGRVDDLRNLLLSMNRLPGVADPENTLIPFARLEEVHFARLVILDDQTLQDIRVYTLSPPEYPVYLAFFCDFDGTLDAFLPRLVKYASTGLTRIFKYCDGFSTGQDLVAWIKQHHREPATAYVNWLGRTMLQVREEETLRLAIRGWIDVQDVDRMTQGHADSLSLADGEMLVPFVAPDDFPVGQNKLTVAHRPRAAALHQGRVILIRDEANLL